MIYLNAKKKKENPSYSLISNIIYVLELQWRHSRMLFVFLLALIPLSLGISFCNIYLPKLVVSEIVDGETLNHLIMSIVIFGVIIVIFNVTNKAIETYMYAATSKFNWAIQLLIKNKALHTDYENIESSNFRLLMDRANQTLWMAGYDSTLTLMPKNISSFITNILGYILFGTIISFASPWIAVLLTITAMINYSIVKSIQKYQYKHRKDTSLLDKKLWYVANNSGKFESAKDIRLYGMNTWLVNIYKSLTKEKMSWERKFAIKYYFSNIIDALIVFIRDGLAYALLIYMVTNGSIRIDEFILYFGAVGSFAGLIGNIFNGFVKINEASLSVCDLRNYFNYEERNNKNTGITVENHEMPCDIELKNVSYRHEGAEQYTLTNVSFKINAGEKIAIVGLNGAGKTTLIKIICGLYNPTIGSIFVNGHDKNEFNIYEYYSLFATVFQDFHFLPVSIANIVSSQTDNNTNRTEVSRCLQLAGLKEKINKLTKGIDSMLDRQLNEDGVDLSGGEKQKLLLARAIYKNAPILILDEPTSALDPIAESYLYQKYNELTQNKTSIFISHRLASTRFCDRILYMEDGKIVENGSHDELIKMNGKYSYLFNVQSQYYKDDMTEKEHF